MEDRILLIRTGGTIDSEAYADPKSPPPLVSTLKGTDSLIMPLVHQLPNHDKVDEMVWSTRQEDLLVKDSQEFTPEDMSALADIIRQDKHRYIVMTHGTDAMVRNAEMLQERLKGTDKVVVMTGAMTPLSMHKQHESDGMDALRFSLQHVMGKESGVYVVGRDEHTQRLGFADPSTVEKNRVISKETSAFTFQPR